MLAGLLDVLALLPAWLVLFDYEDRWTAGVDPPFLSYESMNLWQLIAYHYYTWAAFALAVVFFTSALLCLALSKRA